MVYRQVIPTALERFTATKRQISLNVETVYGIFTCEGIKWVKTEKEAIEHCDQPEAGQNLGGQWIQDIWVTFGTGELFAVENQVYVSRSRERLANPIASIERLPTIRWTEP